MHYLAHLFFFTWGLPSEVLELSAQFCQVLRRNKLTQKPSVGMHDCLVKGPHCEEGGRGEV
eukprot:263281-Pelagomonas_calceolata.AAC.2